MALGVGIRNGGRLGSRCGIGREIWSQNLIGTRVISVKGGIQWDRCQIRVSRKGVGQRKKKRD